MKKVAMVLAGCGHKDGSEITEVVSLIVALKQKNADIDFFCVDKEFNSTNHLTGDPGSTRSLMAESARITRGQIKNIHDLKADAYDALVFPGGFGAAMHLSSWASEGANCQINPDVVRSINEFHEQSKPIGAACIAPVLLAKVLGSNEVTLTLGPSGEASEELEKTGAIHETCEVDDYITDRANKIITSPAYMYGDAPAHLVFKGLQGLASELMEMA